MTEQSAKEKILSKTLYLLVRQIGLTPEEVAQLRLSNLHLAGKHPNISFTPQGSKDTKSVELDLEAHRALVGWLVARPDSIDDFLFPGEEAEVMDPLDIRQAVAAEEKSSGEAAGLRDETSDSDQERASPATTDRPEVGETTVVSGSRPTPPRSRPEMGAPPPGMDATMASSFKPPKPPSSAPEGDEAVKIPLPSAAPKPPPTRPPESESEPAKPPADPIRKALEKTLESAPFESEQVEEKQVDTDSSTKDVEVPAAKPVKPTSTLEKAADRDQGRKKRIVSAEQAAERAKRVRGRSPMLPRIAFTVAVVAVVLVCAVCGGGVWLFGQSDTGSGLLASLGLLGSGIGLEEADVSPEIVTLPVSPLDSPLPTPTLPPTATPSPLPSTNTPAPLPTDTPIPTNTPAPSPTETPAPTETPVPTDTTTPTEAVVEPVPTDTPTPAMKYGAPVLLEPEDRFAFIQGNTIVLRWQPVENLAPDEQYAVRLVYRFQNEVTYQGANIKEPEWTVPLSLFGQIDPPENLYEWFVVIERLNDDGSGTAISQESERRTFTWK